MHEEPLRLIRKIGATGIDELGLSNNHFKVKVDGDLDPACASSRRACSSSTRATGAS